MTRKKALQILIKHAAANCAGVGCGLRTLPSKQEQEKVKQAIDKFYFEAYGYQLDSSAWFNLGLG